MGAEVGVLRRRRDEALLRHGPVGNGGECGRAPAAAVAVARKAMTSLSLREACCSATGQTVAESIRHV